MRSGLGAIVILGALVLAACSSADTSTPVPDDGGPLFGDRTAAAYFQSSCSSCHGGDRSGGIGPSLRPDDLTEADSVYFETIAGGRGGTSMPAWRRAGLNDREITALVEFLRSEP